MVDDKQDSLRRTLERILSEPDLLETITRRLESNEIVDLDGKPVRDPVVE